MCDEQPRETDEPAFVIEWAPISLEHEIVSILDAYPDPGERLESAFRRKEHELGAVFARLSVMDARALHRRLTLTPPDDPIAARFARLIVERRERLLAFLADVRRCKMQQAVAR
jgi:hypothetical protein